MENQAIIINGMLFKASTLIPNYRGDYDCICENCDFNNSHVDFGDSEPCKLVSCAQHGSDNGVKYVWRLDEGVLKMKKTPFDIVNDKIHAIADKLKKFDCIYSEADELYDYSTELGELVEEMEELKNR